MKSLLSVLLHYADPLLLLGWWFVPLAFFLTSFFCVLLGAGGVRYFAKFSPSDPWYVSAKKLYPTIYVLGFARTYFLIVSLIIASIVAEKEVLPIPSFVFTFLCALAGYIGGLLPALLLLRKAPSVKPSISILIRTHANYLSFFFVLCLAINGTIWLLPSSEYSHVIGMIIGFFIIALLSHFGLYVGIAWLFQLVTSSPSRLQRIIEQASDQAGLKHAPRNFVLESASANAFAFQGLGAIGYTSAALDIMSDEELLAIAIHEISHLREGPLDKASRFIPLALFFAYLACIPLIEAVSHPAVIAAGFLVLIAVTKFIRGKISTRLEKRADSLVSESTRDSGGAAYAAALEKLYRHNLAPATLSGKHNSHPDLYDRMLEAGVTPSFERPKPPKRLGYLLGCGFIILTSFFLLTASLVVYELKIREAKRSETKLSRSTTYSEIPLEVHASR